MAEEKATMELNRYAMIKGRFPTTEFSEPPNPLLICQLCQAVMNHPHQIIAGKKSVMWGCYVCLQEIAQDDQLLEPVSMLENLIAVMEISCQRCDETVKIGDLYLHDTNDCSELEIECDACSVFLKKADMEKHKLTQEHIMSMLNMKLDALSTETTDMSRSIVDLKDICKNELARLQSLCQTQEETLTELRSMLAENEEEKKDDIDEKLVWSCYSFPDVHAAKQVNICNVNGPADLIIMPRMINIAYVSTNCIKNSVVAYSFMLHQPPIQYAMGLLKAQSTTPTYAEFINRELLVARFGAYGVDPTPSDMTPDDESQYGFAKFKLTLRHGVNIKEITENEVLKRELKKKTKVTYLIDSRKLANVKIAIYLNDMYTGLKYSVNCEKSVLVPYLYAVNSTDTICPLATIIGYESADKVRELLAEFMADYAPVI
jgi:hypothetical protein